MSVLLRRGSLRGRECSPSSSPRRGDQVVEALRNFTAKIGGDGGIKKVRIRGRDVGDHCTCGSVLHDEDETDRMLHEDAYRPEDSSFRRG